MLFLKLFALIYTSFRSVINERPLEVQHPRVAVLTHLQSGRLQSGSTDAADVFFRVFIIARIKKICKRMMIGRYSVSRET